MYKIFIVEDDHVIAGVLADHLRSWGWENGRNGCLYLMDPHGIVVRHFIPFPFSLAADKTEYQNLLTLVGTQ